VAVNRSARNGRRRPDPHQEDRVATAGLLSADNLVADESLLTGDRFGSQAGERCTNSMGGPVATTPFAYSGTLHAGQGLARVRNRRSDRNRKNRRALQTVVPEPGSIGVSPTCRVDLFAAAGMALAFS
jgi:hypothetical protein